MLSPQGHDKSRRRWPGCDAAGDGPPATCGRRRCPSAMQERGLCVSPPDGALPAFAAMPQDVVAEPGVMVYMDVFGPRDEFATLPAVSPPAARSRCCR